MKKRVVILILTLVFLAGAMAAAGLPLESRAAAATSKPTETPAVTPGSLPEISPAPEEAEPLAGIGGILERLAQDYDPASGAGRRVPLGGIRPRPVSRGRTRHSLGARRPARPTPRATAKTTRR